MRQVNYKKLILPNLPYVFIALLATKLGEAARLSPGTDFSSKTLHIMEGLGAAFQSAVPSFHPIDLCVGILCQSDHGTLWKSFAVAGSRPVLGHIPPE